jgi:hypothetical protein
VPKRRPGRSSGSDDWHPTFVRRSRVAPVGHHGDYVPFNLAGFYRLREPLGGGSKRSLVGEICGSPLLGGSDSVALCSRGRVVCERVTGMTGETRLTHNASRCAIVGRFRLSLATQGLFCASSHASSAIPAGTRIRAATVSGLRDCTAKSRTRCSALRGGEPAAIGGRCRVQRPAEVLPQRRRRL